MLFTSLLRTAALVLPTFVRSEQLPFDHYLWGPKGEAGVTLVEKRQVATATATRVADAACTNGPYTRACWSPGYSIATDFDEKWPTTGNTVTYDIELTNGTCNPDGHGARPCMLLNNQFPGPTVTANWGDIIRVDVKNSLTGNGTSVHWHGMRQLNAVGMDGTNGITECPLAPGDSKTYEFRATQFGTAWYHSHYSAQYGDGAVGSLVINGPASQNYDIDLGAYPVTDWYYQTAFQAEEQAADNAQLGQGPPVADTVLINGTNKNANGGGSYAVTNLIKGKKYRLRLINTSVDNVIRVSLDNHPFTVLTSDIVPVKPIVRNWLLLTVGQRYDVIFTANQTSANYWFRAVPAAECASGNSGSGLSIFRYSDAVVADPVSIAATAPATCVDESPLIPWVPNTVPRSQFEAEVKNLNVDLTRQNVTTNGQSIVVWTVNMSAIDIEWENPTLEYVANGNTSYPSASNLIEINASDGWVFWIIQEVPGGPPIPHPMHLHGHDFYVLGSGSGTYDTQTSINTLLFNNPTRRDVAILPGGGWLALAFPTDNPGAWLMHCHIAFHISQGLGVQFLESKSSIPAWSDASKKTCANWDAYWKSPVYGKADSGL